MQHDATPAPADGLDERKAASLAQIAKWCAAHNPNPDPEDQPMTANELRSWRLERGLTQTVAARLLGTCERRLRDYETGVRTVPDAVAVQVQAHAPAPMPVKPEVPPLPLPVWVLPWGVAGVRVPRGAMFL